MPFQYTAFEEIYIVYIEKQPQARIRWIEMTCASAQFGRGIHFFLNISSVFTHSKSDQNTGANLQSLQMETGQRRAVSFTFKVFKFALSIPLF